MGNELVILKDLAPIDVFVNGGIDAILKQIEIRAKDEVQTANIETVTGRKVFASVAYKVAQSKTVIDNLGKDLVADWKSKSKKVDDVRKSARDYLDNLKDEIRKPLTDYEKAEEERLKKEAEQKQLLEDWDCAIKENELFNRELEVKRKEAEHEKLEQERIAKEKIEREAAERAEREKRIAVEAEERAKREAQAAIEKSKRDAEASERARIAAEVQARVDIERAKELERKRIEDEIKRKEYEAEQERLKEEKRKSRIKHINSIHSKIISDLKKNGIHEETAFAIVDLISNKKISNLVIEY